ncbi:MULTISPECIES: PRC-barrel domain-containing protein [unclassified Sphingobium]|uniref:PRC-barrel domain-containing protein n=1 Tax=unclassified Sphingobium TaxID=2611147 RepID=UPI002225AA9E|nr:MULTISPECIES: PRC-barrel domain-containing protein [unclassified Sphingobium]MCW2382791.1 pyruvate/2-oxoglutarate/acetoin dehydrogenase E1 component [Sphingobium sp. B2D3B]MCW2397036.1 pyruvate/2-oxoglutarate/acetoin dehydrogenase E1 component [Sphingobium sp. B2D3C]
MKIDPAAALALALLLAACSGRDDAANQHPDEPAVQLIAHPGSQAAKGKAALNLTERELLDAELVDTDGTELGDVIALKRGPGGAVEGLVIAVEGSVPEQHVYLPLDGLAPLREGDDWTIVTSLTPTQIAALPKANPDPPTGQPAAATAGSAPSHRAANAR